MLSKCILCLLIFASQSNSGAKNINLHNKMNLHYYFYRPEKKNQVANERNDTPPPPYSEKERF